MDVEIQCPSCGYRRKIDGENVAHMTYCPKWDCGEPILPESDTGNLSDSQSPQSAYLFGQMVKTAIDSYSLRDLEREAWWGSKMRSGMWAAFLTLALLFVVFESVGNDLLHQPRAQALGVLATNAKG